MRFTVCLPIATVFIFIATHAQLRMPAVLSSGMVLQQNDSASFWGWGYNGQKVTVTGSWNNESAGTTVTNHGKWKLKLKTGAAGGPFTVKVISGGQEIRLDDVMLGEVWLCSGQSNMEWSFYNGAKYIADEFPTAYNPNIRFFHVPRMASEYPQEDTRAQWQVCDSNSLKSFSAVGYFFGKKLQQDLGIPIGLINASWGGTPAEVWTPSPIIEGNETLKKSAAMLPEVPWCPVKPGVTYNGMLSPLIPFNIAGAIWYQGEGNTANNSSYAQLLTTMIDAWRNKWNKQFPFYYVQIAPYRYGRPYEGALVQEQQTKAMSHPSTGMVVITDQIDSVTNIHPSDKREVAKRLANWALAETYGKPVDAYKSPVFKNLEQDKKRLILNFEHTPNGLMAKDKNLTGFYISGSTENWLPADGKIEGNQVILWHKKLKEPVHVRYGFGNTIVGNVFSREGLPVIPFRTDDWPLK